MHSATQQAEDSSLGLFYFSGVSQYLGRVGTPEPITLGYIAEDLSGEASGGRSKNPPALAVGRVNLKMDRDRFAYDGCRNNFGRNT